MKHNSITIAALLFLGVAAFAQPGPAGAPPPPAPNAPQPPAAPGRPGPDRRALQQARAMGELRPGPEGRWWSNPELAQKLGITADQAKKMDDILQQHRLRLVDLRATLEKRELTLEPLVSADQPDEPKILAQIDQAAQARAELEKSQRPDAARYSPRADPRAVAEIESGTAPRRSGAAQRWPARPWRRDRPRPAWTLTKPMWRGRQTAPHPQPAGIASSPPLSP